MISSTKIEQALARIDDQRQRNYVEKTERIIAEVEANIKDNPFSLLEVFANLESVYAKGSDTDKMLYNEIESMLKEAITEHTKILIDHAKELIIKKLPKK